MENGESSVYGASLAGGSFDFVKFVKQPQTILRFLSWVFAIVVFATITAEGYVNSSTESQTTCIFNQNDGACSYGVGIGLIGFFGCVVFLIADAYFPMMSSVQDRRRLVLADLGFSALWTFLWFVCFCLLANQWGRTNSKEPMPTDAAHAIITFSFFSVVTWAGLSYMVLQRYRQGTNEIAQNFSEPAPGHSSVYPSAYNPDQSTPYGVSPYPDSYQQPPFTANPSTMGSSDSYQPPAY